MATEGVGRLRRDGQMEKLAGRIAKMNRQQVIALLRSFECSFKLDFTDEFLEAISMERLRHIILGAALHAHNLSCKSA